MASKVDLSEQLHATSHPTTTLPALTVSAQNNRPGGPESSRHNTPHSSQVVLNQTVTLVLNETDRTT